MLNFWIKNTKAKHLIFLDTEFDNRELIQVAMIAYKQVSEKDSYSFYELEGSCNLFINRNVSHFFSNYTGISQNFLHSYGVTQEEVKQRIDFFLKELEINKSNCLFISHGIKQDAQILSTIGIVLPPESLCCTYELSKQVLRRNSNLKLSELCMEAGVYSKENHDAFVDCQKNITVFQYLQENSNKIINNLIFN